MVVGGNASLATSGNGSITANGLTGGTYANALTLSNASNSFTGSGAGLTGLNAGNLASGVLPAARFPALTGDVTSTAGTVTTKVVALQNNPVATTAPTSGQVLTWNGSAWAPATLSVAFSTVTTGTNATALHIGSGGSLDATGTGTISATNIAGAITLVTGSQFSGGNHDAVGTVEGPATASCTGGKTLIGGGAHVTSTDTTSTGEQGVLLDSYPSTPGSNGVWTANAVVTRTNGTGNERVLITAYAYCAS